MIYWYWLLVLLVSSHVYSNEDSFREELITRQLPKGQVYSLFQFTSNWNVNIFADEPPKHFNLFPKSFAEIVNDFGIAELHLSLTQGVWRYDKWGYPIMNAPTGVELWVWFQPQLNSTKIDQNWLGLVHALSGQFCSSLNFIQKAVTTSPLYSMKPLGVWPDDLNPSSYLRYATLSRETVCTENLTPWKKLLPCAGQAGLSTLFNALYLYDSSYHSLAIHLRSVVDETANDKVKLELTQSITSVIDPIHANLKDEWSLKKLFGNTLKSRCPVASQSIIAVDLNDIPTGSFKLSPPSDEIKKLRFGDKEMLYNIYDLTTKDLSNGFDFRVSTKHQTKTMTTSPYLTVHKYTTGYGEEMGGTSCIITNSHPSQTFRISYLDMIPYYVRSYFHTLRIEVNKRKVEPDSVNFIPAYYRDRPATIELLLNIPPLSTATISIDFEKVFLDWMQHPPDSHHGFYIGSSVISALYSDRSNSSGLNEQCPTILGFDSCPTVTNSNPAIFRRIYTEPVLIRVPLPDFSMPYNVICLTSTVIAIGFGSIYNLTTRTFQVEESDGKKTLKEKVLGFFSKFLKTEKVKES